MTDSVHSGIQIRRGISIGFVALVPLLVLARGRGRNSVGLYLIVLIVAGHGPLFVANLVLCDAGVTAGLPVDAVRLLCLGGSAAETGTHKLLAGVAAHSARLRVAVLHSLLLRRELGAGGRRQRHEHSKPDKVSSHRFLLSRFPDRTSGLTAFRRRCDRVLEVPTGST